MKIKFEFFYITFFASIILILEVLLFHIYNFIFDYFIATSVIGLAVIGIGVGAFLANRIKLETFKLFNITCIGTLISIYLLTFLLITHPLSWLISIFTAICFIFPSMFISIFFREHNSFTVYLFDMIGAGLGVILSVLLFLFFRSEEILYLILLIIPIVLGIHLMFYPKKEELKDLNKT